MRVAALCFALFAVGCAHAHNYLDSHAPLYEGTLAAAPGSLEAVRVVSFNIEYALRVPAAIDALRSQPALRDADLLLLQEMDAPGTESIARALGMNYVYCPSSVSPKYRRDVGTAVLSRWPIEARWKVRLPHLARATRHARSVVGVRVRLGSAPSVSTASTSARSSASARASGASSWRPSWRMHAAARSR